MAKVLGLAALILAILAGLLFWKNQQTPTARLTWDDCIKMSDSKILQIYPPICVAPDGRKVSQADLQASASGSFQTQQDQITDWQNYSNKSLNFTFKYPSDFSAIQPQQPYYNLSTPVVTLMSQKSDYQLSNYAQESIIAVSTSQNMPVSTCYSNTDPTQTINGTIYYIKTNSGVAAGNHYEQIMYRTGTNQLCFEITTTVHTSSDWNNIDSVKSNNSIASTKARLEQIVSTFRFQ